MVVANGWLSFDEVELQLGVAVADQSSGGIMVCNDICTIQYRYLFISNIGDNIGEIFQFT